LEFPARWTVAPASRRPTCGQVPVRAGHRRPSPGPNASNQAAHREALAPLGGPSRSKNFTSREESSQSERRADDAGTRAMEWKKGQVHAGPRGEDFDGLITSVTSSASSSNSRFVRRRPGSAKHAHRRFLHLPREHAPDHRPAFAQDYSSDNEFVLVDRTSVEKNPVAILEEAPPRGVKLHHRLNQNASAR